MGGGIWTSVDLDETADFCKYRVSVTGADGATTKEYELTVRVDSDNTNLEYIKVGQHFAKPTADPTKWEVRIPDTTEFANVIIKAVDDNANISDFTQSSYIKGIRSERLTDLNLMAGDKTVSFKVISQSNDASTVYTLAIIGDETALAVKEVTVNGHKAKAPTLADPDYKYHAILPDATVVAVKAVSTKPNAKVSVDGGSVTVGSGSADVSMPISMSEKTVAIEMFKADTAAGAPADLEAKLQLKRLPRDYSALINVDGTAAKQQADGSYVAYVDEIGRAHV